MTLPNNLEDFLKIVLGQPLALGVVAFIVLQFIFTQWDARLAERKQPPIPSYDKTLLSGLIPPVLALGLFLIAASLGYAPWTWAAAAQAVLNGLFAVGGSQIVYGGAKKLVSRDTGQTFDAALDAAGVSVTDAPAGGVRSLLPEAAGPRVLTDQDRKDILNAARAAVIHEREVGSLRDVLDVSDVVAGGPTPIYEQAVNTAYIAAWGALFDTGLTPKPPPNRH